MPKKKFVEYVKHTTPDVVIEFDKIYDMPELAKYNKFRMVSGRKTLYNKNADLILKNINGLLNVNDDIRDMVFFKYLSLKKYIDDGALSVSNELFVSYLISNIFTVEFLECIDQYLDENYHPITKDLSNFKDDSAFLDVHYKILYKIAISLQIVIPATMHYSYVHGTGKSIFDEFMLQVAYSIIKLLEDPKIRIMDKLHRYIEKFVNQAANSDKNAWERIKISGLNPQKVIDNNLNKIIVNVFPKYDLERDIMNLNNFVIEKDIFTYVLRKSDTVITNPLLEDDVGGSEDGSDNMTMADYFIKKQDVYTNILRKNLTKPTIRKIQEKNNISISKKEFEFYLNSIKPNKFQLNLISQIFSKDFNDPENVLSCSKGEFVELVITLYKMLYRLNLKHLASYVVSVQAGNSLSRYQYAPLSKKIQNNTKYLSIINRKYNAVQDIFIKKNNSKKNNNPIIENIILLLNNIFIQNEFGNPDNGNMINKEDPDNIIDNMLDVYTLLIF